VGICVALVVGVFVAFSPALVADFVAWDDPTLLKDETRWRGFGADNLRFMFSSTLLGHWQPLTWLSYAIDYALWGDDPRSRLGLNAFGFHLTNVILHAANAVLVFLVALRLIDAARRPGARAWAGLPDSPRAPGSEATPGPLASLSPRALALAAGLGAAVWAIHPLRVESVAWVTERRDVLSIFFLLLAALAYLRAVEPELVETSPARPRSRAWLWGSAGLLALSLMSKAWGMTFFVMLLMLDWSPLRRLPFSPLRWLSRDARAIFLEKWPFALMGVLAAAQAGRAQEGSLAMKDLEAWGLTERVVQFFYGLAWYARTSVLPQDLATLYPLPTNLSPWEPRFLLAYAIVALAAVALWTLRRRAPSVVTAVGIYGVALGPVLGVAQSGEQFVADRYSYVACIGLSLLAGVGVALLMARAARRRAGAPAAADLSARPGAIPPPVLLGVLASGGVLLTLALLTFAQSTTWKDTETLWRSSFQSVPRAQLAANLAAELEFQGRLDEALAVLDEGLRLEPDHGQSWFLAANIFRKRGDNARAEAAFRAAIPHLDQAFMAHVNLGNVLRDRGAYDAALEQYRAAVADVERGGRRPLSLMPFLALGQELARRGDTAAARRAFERALESPETRTFAERELARLIAAPPAAPAR
jgi:tetratricopeptide (TPR) repeat protein